MLVFLLDQQMNYSCNIIINHIVLILCIKLCDDKNISFKRFFKLPWLFLKESFKGSVLDAM